MEISNLHHGEEITVSLNIDAYSFMQGVETRAGGRSLG